MNKEMVYGTVRHFLTIVSGAILAGNTQSLATAIPDLFNKIAQGDFATIASAAIIVGSLLWSMWVKASLETKNNISKIKTINTSSALWLLYRILSIGKRFLLFLRDFRRNKELKKRYEENHDAVENGDIDEINDLLKN